MLYLTEAELRERTGFKQRPKQRAFLVSCGLSFEVDGRGRILVRREVVEGKPMRQKAQPNWAAIKAA